MSDDHALSGAVVALTGGAGFVGSNLVRHLLASGVAAVTIVDNLLSAERTNVIADERVRFIEGSASDDAVLAQLTDEYDFLFHLSTYHGNQSSIADPIADHDNNLLPSLKVFERAKGFRRLKKLVYAGAGCAVAEKTFSEAHATPESAPISLEMDSPYSISKIVGEFYAVYYFNQHKVPTVRARFQNVYGPGEILGAGLWRGTPATVWRNVTPTFVYKALHGEPLPLENGGVATRDFIFVDDICRGLIGCATKGKAGDVYNLASGRETSILTLATVINEMTGNRSGLQHLPGRSWDRSGKRFGSTRKASAELGYSAEIELAEGLRRTLEWTKANMATIEACVRKHAARLASVKG